MSEEETAAETGPQVEECDVRIGSVKIAANKGTGFYLKVAQGMLTGKQLLNVNDGESRQAVKCPKVQIHALGNAINVAAAVAATLVSKDIGTIVRIQTDQLDISGKNVPKIAIDVIAKGARFIELVSVCGYSVLGARLKVSGEFATVAAEPTPDTVMVDPAGLPYITGENRLCDAGGAAAAIYGWLGIKNDPSFPAPVVAAIKKPLDAKFHAYGPKKCIHVVGPDFRGRKMTREDAVGELAEAYKNILAEFAISGLPILRMLPVSGGIFAGEFMPKMNSLTPEALQKGFLALTAAKQQQVLCASRLEMCIFMEKEFDDFATSFEAHRAA